MNNLDVPAYPLLANVPRVELGAVGTWDISNVTGWHPSADDFASAVAALGCPAVRRPVLKFGHSGEPGAGDPAIGVIDNMAVTEDGQTLIGDFVGVPGWLATEDGAGNSVLSSAYPDRSGEWEHGYVCQLGHTHPFVLHAMALLGVIRPGIGTLESLHDLYTKAPEKESVMPAASLGVMASSVTPDQVRKAYYAGPGSNWSLYIREMFLDPQELIVQDDDDGTLIRVAYDIGADGAVTFGDPQNVKVEYIAARAGAGKPVVAFASHAEARPVAAQSSSAEPVEAPENEEEDAMSTLNESLRQRLGITDANADEATILTALDEALAEQAAPPAVELEVAGELVAASTLLPDGVVTIEASVLDDLRRNAIRGAEARTQQELETREKLVSAAIGDGRIPPARRDHWLSALVADPAGSGQALASLAPGLIPVSEVGHGKAAENTSEDAVMAALFGKDA